MLIPSYGHPDELPEALDSVGPAAGTRRVAPSPVEVVVVDDGSPDRDGDVAAVWAANVTPGCRCSSPATP